MNKKGYLGMLNKLSKLAILVFLGIIPWITLFFLTSPQEVDDKETIHAIIHHKLMTQHCFSNELGYLNKNLINQKQLDSCLEGLDKERASVKIYFPKQSLIYASQEEEHNQRRSTCFVSSAQFCSQLSYPVLYLNEEEEESLETILIETVISS